MRELDLPSPLNVQTLCAHLESVRQRPIVLMPLRGIAPGGPCGLWAATPAMDFVMYRDNTSPVHQSHIILHELSHLIFEHSHGLEEDYRQLLLPNLGATAVQRILGRSAYTVQEEREAETLASLLAQHITRAPASAADSARAESARDQMLQQLLE
ncbi:hypothetical protein HNP84_006452 [Thermocatellispora tengchongensis]|uniref:IrrE N-terminal-like domain-containing protein n=1 Tax=Thermocatellispora tengchongensis TaxID=1073253 RepID=A0A840PFT4_9ACTN|nr:hypothetical protein [Thermocatellispora tengchongensis]MBB5136701.1 hypothetical protein [Thermocatellispora tengchongensis]